MRVRTFLFTFEKSKYLNLRDLLQSNKGQMPKVSTFLKHLSDRMGGIKNFLVSTKPSKWYLVDC
jgi:hypothetical protein